ncbi:hypothetical protein [Halalkalibacter oceani]|uniref:hypothetical protein n=1 Tax=Halalkalibacter oceani TaxID=1653776 RepID=UPI003390B1EB
MNEDLKLLITAGINTGTSVREINNSIKQLQKVVNQKKLNLNIKVNQDTLKQIEMFNTRMKALGDQALNTRKVIEEVTSPTGAKVTRTHWEGVGGAFSEIESKAKQTQKSMAQTSEVAKETKKEFDSIATSTQKNEKSAQKFNSEIQKTENLVKRTSRLNSEGKKVWDETYQSASKARQEVVKYNEHGEQTNKVYTENYNNLRKLSQERAKLRRELVAMQSDGRISQSQFNDLSSRLNTSTSQVALNKYKEQMKSLTTVTSQATANQAKLNQEQGKFRINLNQLHNQGKITEDQLRQFSNAVNTTKSVGQVKRLSQEIDKLRVKASSVSSTPLTQFDLDLARRQFDNKASEAIRQYPSIDKRAIADLQNQFKSLEVGTDNVRNKIRDYNMSLTETVSQTKRVTANTNTMAGAFQNAMVEYRRLA